MLLQSVDTYRAEASDARPLVGSWGETPMQQRWSHVPYAVKRNKPLVSVDGGFINPHTKKLKLVAPVIVAELGTHHTIGQALSSDRTLAASVRADKESETVRAYFAPTVRASQTKEEREDIKPLIRAVDICVAPARILQSSCCFAHGTGDLYCLIKSQDAKTKDTDVCVTKIYRLSAAHGTWTSKLVCVSGTDGQTTDVRVSQHLAYVDRSGFMYVLQSTRQNLRLLQIAPDGVVRDSLLMSNAAGELKAMATRVLPGGHGVVQEGFELHLNGQEDHYYRLVFEKKNTKSSSGTALVATSGPRLTKPNDAKKSQADLELQLKACEAYGKEMLSSVEYQWVAWDAKRDSDMLAKSSHERVFAELSGAVQDTALRIQMAKQTGLYSAKYDDKEKKELYGAMIEAVFHGCTTGELPLPLYADRSKEAKHSLLNKYFSAVQTNAFWILTLKRQLRGAKPSEADDLASRADCEYIHSKLAEGKTDPDTKRQYFYTRTLNRPFLQAITTVFRGNPQNDFEKWPFSMDHLQVLSRLMGITGFPQLEAVCGDPVKKSQDRLILTRLCRLRSDPATKCPTVKQLLFPAPGVQVKMTDPAQRLLAFKLRNVAYALNCYDMKSVNFALSNIMLDLSQKSMIVSIADVTSVRFGATEDSLAADLAQLRRVFKEAGMNAAAAFLDP